jgi:hypothetical protein
MLPIHAAIIFGAPAEVVKVLIKAYSAGCSAHDDQGMLPLHLAFRSGSSEEIVLTLLDAYPEAIERVDYKGRLPSMLAPKTSMSYGDIISEAFIKGPAYYYWASRVATADRTRSETAMTKQIKQLEEKVRASNEAGKAVLDKTEKELTEEIEALSVENVELKERLVWYETKYDGADEKEKVLVDHTNSLAERLRLTSLSEEHLATKLAKLEAKLQEEEADMEQAKTTAEGEKMELTARVATLEEKLAEKENEATSLNEKLEKKTNEADEMKAHFEKERQLFEKQVDASKECLMELIASSKEDKRMFEEQIQALQSNVQQASVDERRMFEEDSQELRRQLVIIQNEVQKATAAASHGASASVVRVSSSLEERLDSLQQEVANHTRSCTHHELHTHMEVEEEHYNEPEMHAVQSSKASPRQQQPEDNIHEENAFDTYVSTTSTDDQMRDDLEAFSQESDVDAAIALGRLTDEQRVALEQLDLSGSREEIAAMLARVPGLTKNQVKLLVDVALSFTA